MSLESMLFSNWWKQLKNSHQLHNQDFGLGLDDDFDLPTLEPRLMILNPRKRHHYHPYERSLVRKSGGASTLKADKDKFHVNLDVQQFSPEEITVKVSGRNVIVEGKHEEKQDEHGWISRQFVRKYMVPEQCEVEDLQSNLSSDGILSITCPSKKALENKNERIIPIHQTGQPAITDQPGPSKSPTKEESSQKIPVTRSQEKASKNVKAA